MTAEYSELDSDLIAASTVTSTTRDSLDSADPSLIVDRYSNCKDSEHENGITYPYRACNRIKKLSNSNSYNGNESSSILAGNIGITSKGSSDSFYSAQSTMVSNEELSADLNVALTESKQRDSNDNFASGKVDCPLSSPNSNDQTSYMMPFLERLSKELNIDSPKNHGHSTNLLKRLSVPFAQNPEDFKNRLITIIEENELTGNQYQPETSAADLTRITSELKKICKFIMDESMPPEMLLSPASGASNQTSNSPLIQNATNVQATPENKQSPAAIDLGMPDQRQGKKFYRKTPKFVEKVQKSNQSPLWMSTFKKNSGTPQTPGDIKSPRTPINTSPYNDSFTYWETYCKENGTPVSDSKKKRRSCSVPDIIYRIESENIKRNADIQLRALNESGDESFITPRSTSEHNVLDKSFETHTNSPDIELDLGMSILEEVARKRQRCYETEKTIREIGAEINSSSSLPSSDDDHVLEYLNFVVGRCSEYQKCLMKNRDTLHKTLTNIDNDSTDSGFVKQTPRKIQSRKCIQKSQSAKPKSSVNSNAAISCRTPNRKLLLTRSTSKSSVKSKLPGLNLPTVSTKKLCPTVTPRNPKLQYHPPASTITSARATPVKSIHSSHETRHFQQKNQNKAKFFETPGTVSSKPSIRSTSIKFFDTPDKSDEKSTITLKPKKIFTGMEYYGYSTVKSPVAEYIKSTDTKLVQNVEGRTEEFLLTPKTKKSTPANSVEALRMKFNGQQKEKARQDNIENIPIVGAPNRFREVMYELPSKICNINLNPSKSRDGRGQILREMNDKRRVIQHMTRLQDESTEQSIHILKPAEKTNCLGRTNSTISSRKPWK